MSRTLALVLALIVVAPSANADCLAGTKCLSVAPTTKATQYKVGDVLPRGQYQMLMNSGYYGLPPTDASAMYFRVDYRIFRVRPDTLEILEDVTHLANRAF